MEYINPFLSICIFIFALSKLSQLGKSNVISVARPYFKHDWNRLVPWIRQRWMKKKWLADITRILCVMWKLTVWPRYDFIMHRIVLETNSNICSSMNLEIIIMYYYWSLKNIYDMCILISKYNSDFDEYGAESSDSCKCIKRSIIYK